MGLTDHFINALFADAFGLKGVDRDLFFAKNTVRGKHKRFGDTALDTLTADLINLEGTDRDFHFANDSLQQMRQTSIGKQKHQRTRVAAENTQSGETLPPPKETVTILYRRGNETKAILDACEPASHGKLVNFKAIDETPSLAEESTRTEGDVAAFATAPESDRGGGEERREQLALQTMTDDAFMAIVREKIAQRRDAIEEHAALQDSMFVFVRFNPHLSRYTYLCEDLSVTDGDVVRVPVGNRGRVMNATVVGTLFCPKEASPYPIVKMKSVIEKV